MKEKNHFIRYVIFLLIVIIIVLFIAIKGFSSSTNSKDDIKSKVKSEISYLDSKILFLLNRLNNIVDANYYVSIHEVNENQDSSQNSDTSGSKQEGQNSSSNQNSESSSSSSSGESSQGEGSEQGNTSSSSDVTKTAQMNPDIISKKLKEPIDWETIEGTTQTIYSSWSVIILDLYKLNANGEDILGFSDSLDKCMESIQANDKQASLSNLATLYSYLPKFLEGHLDDNKTNTILKVKSNIINAYSQIDAR